ncbi:hypothetical protein FXO38_00374 [Capsicum annuum]|nr:hypothetical protein FXO38_00374 [Capsicum annuum]
MEAEPKHQFKEETWEIVTFRKRHAKSKGKSIQDSSTGKRVGHPPTQVKAFNAATGIDGPNYSPVVKERGPQYPTESSVSTLHSTPSTSTSYINLVSPTIPSRDLSNHHLGALDKTSMVESINSTPPVITPTYQGEGNQNGHLPSNKISTTNEKHQHGNSIRSKQPSVSRVSPIPTRTHSTILAGDDTPRHEHHSECISPKPADSPCIARSILPGKTGQRLHRSCSPKAREPNVDASPDSSHKSGKHGTSLNRGIQLPNESNILESAILSNKNIINSSQPTLHSLNLSKPTIQKQHLPISGRKPRRRKGLPSRKHIPQRVQRALQRSYFSICSKELEEMPSEDPQTTGFYPSNYHTEGCADEGIPNQIGKGKGSDRESKQLYPNDKLSNLECQAAAGGLARGIVIMWKEITFKLEEISISDQGIHVMVKVPPLYSYLALF